LIFCITDIETNGGNNSGNNITEIASILTNGTEILDRFECLIKPDYAIPPQITNLTGITNQMLANAPSFNQVFENWMQFAKDATFVAHNVAFDYNFIANAIERNGKYYSPKKLCTVRLSRKVFPNIESYSLGKLCSSLNIKIENRHRAMGDAEATVKLFHALIANDKNKVIQQQLEQQKKTYILPPFIDENTYHTLPMLPGVYYLKDKLKKILYIGKAKNIKQRISTHFRTAKRSLLDNLYFIDYTLTGNELLACLIESEEIKKNWPPYNVAQKKPTKTYTITSYTNQNLEIKLAIKLSKVSELSPLFGNQLVAREYINTWIYDKKLCPRLAAFQQSCKHLDKCACNDTKKHNQSILLLVEEMKAHLPSFCLIDKGVSLDEKTIIWVQNGKYMGFVMVKRDVKIDLLFLTQQIIPQKEYLETASIIGQYLIQYIKSESEQKYYLEINN